jgi:hypothetical protein
MQKMALIVEERTAELIIRKRELDVINRKI